MEDIIHLLSFCLKTTKFTYNGTYYHQVFGTAMGSPVSAVIANMVMEDVEQRALATSSVKPFSWKRYVDDVISAVSGNEAERLLSHLNSLEPSIQFTLECEKDRHLPFLDLNVSRGVQGNLETSVYRKPIHTTPMDLNTSYFQKDIQNSVYFEVFSFSVLYIRLLYFCFGSEKPSHYASHNSDREFSV